MLRYLSYCTDCKHYHAQRVYRAYLVRTGEIVAERCQDCNRKRIRKLIAR